LKREDCRSLKNGAGFDGTHMRKYLLKLVNGSYVPVKLDRWNAECTQLAGAGAGAAAEEFMGMKTTTMLPQQVFNNYMGFGSDALITLRFHTAREANPAAYKSRLGNKIKYVGPIYLGVSQPPDLFPSRCRCDGELCSARLVGASCASHRFDFWCESWTFGV
jgi:hypothetical protein